MASAGFACRGHADELSALRPGPRPAAAAAAIAGMAAGGSSGPQLAHSVSDTINALDLSAFFYVLRRQRRPQPAVPIGHDGQGAGVRLGHEGVACSSWAGSRWAAPS